MITFVILFIVAIIVAVIAEIALFKQRQSDKTILEWQKEYSPFFQAVDEVKEFGSNLLEKQQPSDLSEPFKAWAAKNLGPGDEVLKAWLIEMPEPALNALIHKLADFCTELNLDLHWLVSDQIKLEPKLKETMHEVVVSYCWACWKAVQVQPDIEVFRTFMAVVEDPAGTGQQDISQKLLNDLRKHNLAPEPNPDWFLASEKQRRVYLSQLIRQAIELDQTKFYTIFRGVISTNGSTGPQVAETPPPPSQPTEAPR